MTITTKEQFLSDIAVEQGLTAEQAVALPTVVEVMANALDFDEYTILTHLAAKRGLRDYAGQLCGAA